VNVTVILRGITWDHPRGRDSIVATSQAWCRQHPGVDITWHARSLQDFADYPLDRLTAEYDLLVIDHPHVPVAAERHMLARMDGAGHDDALALLAWQSVGSSHASYQVKNHQYGLAIDAAAQVAAYRPDLLPHPPTTWNAVLSLAEDGRVLWPAKPVDAVSSFLTLAANSGHPAADTPTELVERAAAREVIGLMHRLAKLVPSACLSENPIETAERLSSGDVYAYAPLLYGYTNYSRPGFRQNRLSYINIPQGRRGVAGSCLGGAGIAVSEGSQAADIARDFAFWAASAEAQTGVYYQAGGQPGNALAWEDDSTNADCFDFFRNTRRTLEGAWLRPRFTGWLELQDEAGSLLNAALRGELPDEDCLDSIDGRYRDLVAPSDPPK